MCFPLLKKVTTFLKNSACALNQNTGEGPPLRAYLSPPDLPSEKGLQYHRPQKAHLFKNFF